MRVLYLLMFGCLLSACNTFNVVPGYNPYVSLAPPVIQGWQKADNVGRTNVDKRWQDFQSCGVKNYNNGTLDLSVEYSNMSTNDVIKRRRRIESCMKNKGYIYLGSKCVDGKNNKLTGLCN